MRNPLVPALLLVVLPALYLAARAGALARPRLRRLVLLGLAGVVVAALPGQGLELDELKRFNLLLAAAAALVCLLTHFEVAWTRNRSHLLVVCSSLAALAWLGGCNIGAFHGNRLFVHLHDVAHYYLGAKYLPELRPSELYVAMVRAEADLHGERLQLRQARDLATYEVVDVEQLLAASDQVKGKFSARRWGEFKLDVEVFHRGLGQRWPELVLDHGFNATPAWSFFGAGLARLVPAGNERGLLLLALLDPLLLLAMFVAVAWAFGRFALVLALLYFPLVFGATFGWTGGAFLRYLWLFALVVGFSCLARRRDRAAGACFALAVALRVFPVFFLLPLGLMAVAAMLRHRGSLRRHRRFWLGFVATCVAVVAATATLPRGLEHWPECFANLRVHVDKMAPNVVGATEVLAWEKSAGPRPPAAVARLKAKRQNLQRAQLWLLFLPVLAAVAMRVGRQHPAGSVVFGFPLLFAGTSVAAYDYAALILLVPAFRGSPRALALLFAVEAASYTLQLFEADLGLLFVYRSVLLAFLYAALFFEPVSRASGRMPVVSSAPIQ